jgi:malonyl-CoA O-methyltransferase
MNARKQQIAASFNRVSHDYSAAANIQRLIANRLAGRIMAHPFPRTARVLEVGAGTGLLTRELINGRPWGHYEATDMAPAMVEQCAAITGVSACLMDAENPTVSEPCDLVCASMVFQWVDDLRACLNKLAACLKPGGRLAYATLIKGSLAEWRAAHQELGLTPSILDFPSVSTLQEYWPPEGTGLLETQDIPQTFDTTLDFMASLKTIGARTPAPDTHPLSPGTFRKVLRALDHQGQVKITYRVAYGLFVKDTP